MSSPIPQPELSLEERRQIARAHLKKALIESRNPFEHAHRRILELRLALAQAIDILSDPGESRPNLALLANELGKPTVD